MMHDKIEPIQLRHIITCDIAKNKAFKMTAYPFWRQLFCHSFIIFRFASVNTNI